MKNQRQMISRELNIERSTRMEGSFGQRKNITACNESRHEQSKTKYSGYFLESIPLIWPSGSTNQSQTPKKGILINKNWNIDGIVMHFLKQNIKFDLQNLEKNTISTQLKEKRDETQTRDSSLSKFLTLLANIPD